MTALHAHFLLRNQQAFQRLLDISRSVNTQAVPGSTLSASGGRSWNKPSPLSAGLPSGATLDVNARDWLGRTVLHLAVSALDPAALEFVKLLLSHPRIDINLADTESHWTPLHRALYVGNIPACVLLLQRSDIDVSLKDYEGYTAFDVYNSTVEGTKPNAHEATDLYTWGTNRNAALGVGDGDDRTFPELAVIPPQKELSDDSKLPLRSRFEARRAEKISMAKLHTAVVTSEPCANLRICGFGSGGRLGAGIAQHTSYELSCPKDLTSEAQITTIALGQDHTLALTNPGSVLSWGLNRFLQLGYALDGGQVVQAAPRRIVGPLKKEIVVGISACRTASACWNDHELFTWGTNSGQLGYDRVGTPVQVLPRRVTQITIPVIDVALSDVAMAVLLSSRDVHCFHNGRIFKINFPTQSFPDEIQVYRPPIAPNNASIAKVVSCENTFAALSSNGEIFTFTFNMPAPVTASDSSAMPNKPVATTQVKPQRIWSLRKQFTAVKDVALGSDGTILLCTESGHVYLRNRSSKTSKFVRVPLLQRVVSVAASSAGAFAALKAECMPAPIRIEGNSVAQDLELMQPFLSFSDITEHQTCPGSPISNAATPSSGDVQPPPTPSEVDEDVEEDSDGAFLKRDVKTILRLLDLLARDSQRRKGEGKGIFEGTRPSYDADLFIRVDSGFEFPVHRVIFSARSGVLRDVILGRPAKDSVGKLRCHLEKVGPDVRHASLIFSGCHPLTVLMLAMYLYTDDVPAIWDRRVALVVSDKLAACVPKAAVSDIRTELHKLAALLHLAALTDVLDIPVKRLPTPRLAHDMRALLDSVSANSAWVLGSPSAHPVAPDTILELEDAEVRCHSVILRARSPFFASLFGDPEWTISRKQPDRQLTVKLGHMRSLVMKFVLQFVYIGGNEEIFDVLEFTQTPDDVLDFLFEVMDVAGELLLDRLLLICSSVILRFLNINNACSILSEASFFNASQLRTSVQGYLARNLETMLESHMLDDLSANTIRQFAEFVRARQEDKLPVTRSGKMIERALEKWKDWLDLQDIPQPTVPGRSVPSGQTRHSPKLSPAATGTTGKRNRRPSVMQMSASYSPPQDLRLHLTPPSVPIRDNHADGGPGDMFTMDGVQEEIPPLDLPAREERIVAGDQNGSPRAGPSPAVGKYGPWKARVARLPANKMDLRAIMAETESLKVTSPSPTPPSRSVGSHISTAASSARISQKADPSQASGHSETGPWRIPNANTDSGLPARSTEARKTSEAQHATGPSGLGRDLRDDQGAVRTAAPSSSGHGMQVPGKGKTTLGPTFTPARQLGAVNAVPMSRRVSEGTTKAWNMSPSAFALEPELSDTSGSSKAPVSFLTIQQQQQDQDAGHVRVKKSLLEIQEEERARAEEERALREEIEFMQWWAAEEERIRRETQAQPGPPITRPGPAANQGGKKGKGGHSKKQSQMNKKAEAFGGVERRGGGESDGGHDGHADSPKATPRRRLKPKVDTAKTDA